MFFKTVLVSILLLLSTAHATEVMAKKTAPTAQVGDQVTVTSDTTIPLPATITAINKGKYTVQMLPSFQFKGGEQFQITARQIKLVFPNQEAIKEKAETEKTINEAQSKKTILSASASAGNKAKSLNGLYTRFGQTFEGKTMVCKEEQFYFYPDGRVYHGLPVDGPAHLDWSKALSEKPCLCGTYGIIGDTIVFQWRGDSTTPKSTDNWKLKRRGNNLELNGMIADKAPVFGNNAKLDGIWTRQEIIVNQGKPSTSPVTYVFSADGKVDRMQRQDQAMKKMTGKYQLTGNDLEISFPGENLSRTIYPQHLDSRSMSSPDRLSINGKLFEKMK